MTAKNGHFNILPFLYRPIDEVCSVVLSAMCLQHIRFIGAYRPTTAEIHYRLAKEHCIRI